MAENLRSRHAFGSEANIGTAIENGLIDEYDILFLDEKKIGWVDKNGNPVIVEYGMAESEVEAKIEAANTELLEQAKAYADEQIAEAAAVEIVEF